jgi:hypothetical protein
MRHAALDKIHGAAGMLGAATSHISPGAMPVRDPSRSNQSRAGATASTTSRAAASWRRFSLLLGLLANMPVCPARQRAPRSRPHYEARYRHPGVQEQGNSTNYDSHECGAPRCVRVAPVCMRVCMCCKRACMRHASVREERERETGNRRRQDTLTLVTPGSLGARRAPAGRASLRGSEAMIHDTTLLVLRCALVCCVRMRTFV